MTTIDKTAVIEAYEEVRSDCNPLMWLVCKYEVNHIYVAAKGEDYEELLGQLGEDDRAFAFVRIIMGDELSKRAKFAFITWIGNNVMGIKKAKVGTDKSLVKAIIKNFAAEILASYQEEVSLDVIKTTLLKAGGANYGTGVRD